VEKIQLYTLLERKRKRAGGEERERKMDISADGEDPFYN